MNNINRNNYEEFFILHLDNELNAEQQQALQLFLQQNPDLQAELDLLSGTKLSIDETVVFPDKALLFAGSLLQQTEEQQQVSAQDSEIIMYLDAELTANDKKAFEQKLAGDTVLQQQVALFAKTKLQASAAEVFPDKALLYKEEENRRRIVPMYWLRMGVAAAVLLTLGVGGFKWLNNPVKETEHGSMAVTTTTDAKATNPVIPVVTEGTTAAEDKVEQEQAEATIKENNITIQQPANTASYAANKNTGNTNVAVTNQPATTLLQTGVTNNNGNNNLPSSDKNPYINGMNNAAVENGIAEIKPLNTTGNNTIVPQVKNNSQPAFASNSQHVFDEVVEVEEPENKKNKLRGFLRKVTRNFQKQTSIDMTNGDDQLLVAGFALKM